MAGTGAGVRQHPEPRGTRPHDDNRPIIGHPATAASGGNSLDTTINGVYAAG